MSRARLILSPLPFVLVLCLSVAQAPAFASGSWAPVTLSDAVGTEIDLRERDRYHLFPGLPDFALARVLSNGDGEYRLEITLQSPASGTSVRTKPLSRDAFEETREHLSVVEAYERARDAVGPGEIQAERLVMLRFAARGHYDVARQILADLAVTPGGMTAAELSDTERTFERLDASRHALFRPEGLYEREGRIGFLFYSGLYGLWTAIAVPIAFDLDRSQEWAASLLVIPPSVVMVANAWSSERDIGKGRSNIIALGGNLGTWEGLGWALVSDADGRQATTAALAAGYGGILSAIVLTSQIPFTEGQGSLTHAALPWGAWYGTVAGVLTDRDEEGSHWVLRSSLIGSAVAPVVVARATRGIRMTEGRVRLINLGGILGIVAGFGLDGVLQVEDGKTALLIAGATSTVGLYAGVRLSRPHDQDRYGALGSSGRGRPRSAGATGGLRPGWLQNRFDHGRIMPTLEYVLAF